ncbi:hypothetical protein CBZ_13360 [Cellulomonas biazotea]|uniref:Uncharacterized protein n=1 Tax=Cellulomonas biazotea TaxID=1709 RepID=A0A402DQ63_9CELL|nr:hypothetical protein CBZ_13360 [Cellulomonas biazotea]
MGHEDGEREDQPDPVEAVAAGIEHDGARGPPPARVSERHEEIVPGDRRPGRTVPEGRDACLETFRSVEPSPIRPLCRVDDCAGRLSQVVAQHPHRMSPEPRVARKVSSRRAWSTRAVPVPV